MSLSKDKLGKPPLLRSVDRLTKSKDVDFLQFFDSRKTQVFQNLRHRYQDVYFNVLDGFSHLRLFTKYLKRMIDASKTSANAYSDIVKEYRAEEPTLITGHTGNDTVTSVKLPESFANEIKEDDMIKKTDIDAFAEVFEFERRLSLLLVTFWNRLENEIYSPLYQFRKAALIKIDKLHNNIIKEYDKLIKANTILRDHKTKAILGWNELCDARHTLRKSNDAKTEKKVLKLISNLESKVTKLFTTVIDTTDQFNKQQTEFWESTLKETLLQFEAMEYTRIQFYTEYYEKYKDLLSWRKSELENGEKTLQRAKKDILKPIEILEVNTYTTILNNGKYNTIQPLQYELPCMPNEVNNIKDDKLSETRIDPSILKPIYNPFNNALEKVSTTRKSVVSRSTRASRTGSVTHAITQSISLMSNTGSVVGQNDNMFTDDLQSQKIFARTQRNYAPSPHRLSNTNSPIQLIQTKSQTILDDYESDKDYGDNESNEMKRSQSAQFNESSNKPKKPSRKQTRPNKPPPSLNEFKKQIEIQKSAEIIKPSLPPRKMSTKTPVGQHNNNKPKKPPRRGHQKQRSLSDSLNTIVKKQKKVRPPKLPKKNVEQVVEKIRRDTLPDRPKVKKPKGKPPKLPPKPPPNKSPKRQKW